MHGYNPAVPHATKLLTLPTIRNGLSDRVAWLCGNYFALLLII